eukprot:CAMPEP_0202458626 /NCGR_PEP_ID=MMETSP1360-20130828/26499_1 /ASSEMBLY_ACC=CAM_ASM_000848 /TAXON_ID=515479 /ORGANISM="Licmophora paradoxa, Strain CCMP2313" /LENGTH=127 /DNA_ID=CAMNT_0049079251 /DNA_START=291 /DNA_END=674 /DNA_ORIENTATION=-
MHNRYGNYGNGNSHHGYDPESNDGGAGIGADASRNLMEEQNNDRISELSDQVARLKGLTIDIGNEVREQNSLLDDMGDGFSGVQNLLANSLNRIGNMLKHGGPKHMCYMIAFVVAVMVFLYWTMKFR